MYVIVFLYMFHPWYFNSQVLVNTLMTAFPYVVQTVDTYAFALREQLMEEETDIGQNGDEGEATNAKAEKLEQLHKNFSLIRKVQFLDRNVDSPLSAETLLQVSLTVSGILSLVTIVYSAENETQESKTARVVIGILMSLIFHYYYEKVLTNMERPAQILGVIVLNLYLIYRGVPYYIILFGITMLLFLDYMVKKFTYEKKEWFEKYHPYCHYIAGFYVFYCVFFIQRSFN